MLIVDNNVWKSRDTTKSHNIFTIPLFWVVVDHDLISLSSSSSFSHFIQTYGGLTPHLLWDFVVFVEEF